MAEEVPEAKPREIPCNIAVASEIISMSELRQMLYDFAKVRSELIAVKRSVSRGIEQIDSIVDALEQQLEP